MSTQYGTPQQLPSRALDGEIEARPTYYADRRDRPAPVVLDAVATVAPAQLLTLTGGRVMVTGTPHQLSQHVAKWRAEGRLVHADTPQPDGVPGRYALVVQLAPRALDHRTQAATVQPPFWTPRRALVAAAFALIVLAVLAWAVAVALAWLASNLLLVLGVLVVVAVIAAKAGPRVCQTIVTVTHRH
ncbi:MAG: hypothetical protein HOV87_12280 [Catenulispora sp.]|nr:hypothetical protein [Catenulispora sp.]